MPVPTSTLAAGTTMPGETPYAGPQRVDKTVKRRISEIVNMLQFAFANVTRNAVPAWAEAKRFSYDRIAMWAALGSALPLLLVTAGVECQKGMMCGVVMSVVVGVFCSAKILKIVASGDVAASVPATPDSVSEPPSPTTTSPPTSTASFGGSKPRKAVKQATFKRNSSTDPADSADGKPFQQQKTRSWGFVCPRSDKDKSQGEDFADALLSPSLLAFPSRSPAGARRHSGGTTGMRMGSNDSTDSKGYTITEDGTKVPNASNKEKRDCPIYRRLTGTCKEKENGKEGSKVSVITTDTTRDNTSDTSALSSDTPVSEKSEKDCPILRRLTGTCKEKESTAQGSVARGCATSMLTKSKNILLGVGRTEAKLV